MSICVLFCQFHSLIVIWVTPFCSWDFFGRPVCEKCWNFKRSVSVRCSSASQHCSQTYPSTFTKKKSEQSCDNWHWISTYIAGKPRTWCHIGSGLNVPCLGSWIFSQIKPINIRIDVIDVDPCIPLLFIQFPSCFQCSAKQQYLERISFFLRSCCIASAVWFCLVVSLWDSLRRKTKKSPSFTSWLHFQSQVEVC